MPLLSGLQFCFRMNETSGNRVDSVNGLVLSPTGTIGSAAGKFGNAVDIGGGTSRLAQTVSSTLTAGTGAFTVMCWVRYDTLSTSYPVARWDGIGDWLFFVSGTGRASFEIRHNNDSTNTSAQTPSGAIITGEWFMLIGWFDPSVGANGTAYVQLNNGTVYSAALTLPKNNPANLLMSVGVINPTVGVFGSTDGRVDQVCKWSRVLTADERAELWNNGDGRAFPFVTGIGGEVGWWCPSLDDAGNGTTNLLDLSGVNNNRGTLTNMDPATDWVADTANGGIRALDFDGVNDFVSASSSSSANLSGDFTVSLHARIRNPGGFYQILFETNKYRITSGNGGFSIYVYQNNIEVWRWQSGTYTLFLSRALPSPLPQWLAVQLRRTGSSVALFFDGVQAGGAATVTQDFTDSAFNIGGATSFPANARLDDIRLFARSLLDSELLILASKRGYQPITSVRRRRNIGNHGL